jgi:large subunit ribosomal protein L28
MIFNKHQGGRVANYCQLTGRRPGFGNQVSHSQRKTARRWDPNLQHRRYYLPSEGRVVALTLSTKAIKTIDRIGIDAAVAQMRQRGEKI